MRFMGQKEPAARAAGKALTAAPVVVGRGVSPGPSTCPPGGPSQGPTRNELVQGELHFHARIRRAR